MLRLNLIIGPTLGTIEFDVEIERMLSLVS